MYICPIKKHQLLVTSPPNMMPCRMIRHHKHFTTASHSRGLRPRSLLASSAVQYLQWKKATTAVSPASDEMDGGGWVRVGRKGRGRDGRVHGGIHGGSRERQARNLMSLLPSH